MNGYLRQHTEESEFLLPIEGCGRRKGSINLVHDLVTGRNSCCSSSSGVSASQQLEPRGADLEEYIP